MGGAVVEPPPVQTGGGGYEYARYRRKKRRREDEEETGPQGIEDLPGSPTVLPEPVRAAPAEIRVVRRPLPVPEPDWAALERVGITRARLRESVAESIRQDQERDDEEAILLLFSSHLN
jgi:hypothetical protein